MTICALSLLSTFVPLNLHIVSRYQIKVSQLQIVRMSDCVCALVWLVEGAANGNRKPRRRLKLGMQSSQHIHLEKERKN